MIRITLGELQEQLALIRYTTDKDAQIGIDFTEDNEEVIWVFDGHKVKSIQVTRCSDLKIV